MSNEQMVTEIQEGRDQDGSLLTALWNNNSGYISAILQNYDGLAEEDDLWQESFLGLLEAVRRWDSERGVPFMVYAGNWIRSVAGRYVERLQGIPINKQTKIRQLHKVESDFQQMHGREPSDAELSELMDITQNEVLEIKKAENGRISASLDAEQSMDDGDAFTLEELVPGVDDPEADAVDHYQREQLASTLWGEVDQLDPNQAEVLHERFQQEKQLSEIAGESGRSVAQVEGDQRKGLAKLRTDPQSRKRLLPFWDDDRIRSGSLRGNGVGAFNRTWESSTEKTALRMYRRSE